MSVREDIAKNIVTTLKAVKSPISIKLVTREPFDFDKLSNQQFPAVLIRSAAESRNDNSVGGSLSTRRASVDFELVCFVKAKQIDTARNNIIEAVEEGLDSDRTRGGHALNTEITTISIDEGQIQPIGGVIITVNINYIFTRGST